MRLITFLAWSAFFAGLATGVVAAIGYSVWHVMTMEEAI